MQEAIIHFFSGVPAHWAAFFLAMTPIGEVRLSIPVAITVYHLSPTAALFWSAAGNIFAGIAVLAVLEPMIFRMLKISPRLGNLWSRYIGRLEMKHKKSFDRWGSLALVLFVAIPFPLTGIFSGVVAASIFQIPFVRAAILLAVGALIAGGVVTAATMGVMKFF